MGQLRLGSKGHVFGNLGLFSALCVVGPLLGQIEFAVEEGVAVLASVTQEDTDLAVFDPASGAAVLALDPQECAPFLRSACLS